MRAADGSRHPSMPAGYPATLCLVAAWWVLAGAAGPAVAGAQDGRSPYFPARPGPQIDAPAAALPAPGTAAPARLLPPRPAGEEELGVESLVERVLATNPSLAQMAAAYEAALARYPQVTSLEDPMFATAFGPGTFRPDDPGLEFASRLELSQKYPWPGKLRLRGDSARAEAQAAGAEVEDMRLRLAESTRSAFYDYYLAARALEVNAEGLRLLAEFRRNAEARYRTGLVPQQDILQADVEIGRERNRRLALERMRDVAAARINTLLSLPPDRPLPPPPASLRVTEQLPDAGTLREAALARRPDLRALADRVRAEEAALGLACKDYYPDFEPFVMYDRFMGNTADSRDLAVQVGVRMNLPVRLDRRRGAVAEAQARVAQRRAELARQVNEAAFEVQQAYARVRESARSVRLYETVILPAAERNVASAQPAYTTGKIPFLSLIEAQRNRVMVRDQYYEAVADYFRRLAALERAAGGTLNPAAPGPVPPAPRPGS